MEGKFFCMTSGLQAVGFPRHLAVFRFSNQLPENQTLLSRITQFKKSCNKFLYNIGWAVSLPEPGKKTSCKHQF
jgi:hypothetical protein